MLGAKLKELLEGEGYATVQLEIGEEKETLTETLSDSPNHRLLVEVESDGDFEKVTISIEDTDGEQFYAVLRCKAEDEDSAENLAKVIIDQLDYWV